MRNEKAMKVLQNAKVTANRMASPIQNGLSLVNSWALMMSVGLDKKVSDSAADSYGACSEFSETLAPVLRIR